MRISLMRGCGLSKDKNTQKVTEALSSRLRKINIGTYQRHIFLCGGPKCCSEALGDEVWEHLKARTRDLHGQGINVARTRVHCLRICQQGPIALVYPEGSWYKMVDKEGCDRIINEHLLGDKPVNDLLIVENPLPLATRT